MLQPGGGDDAEGAGPSGVSHLQGPGGGGSGVMLARNRRWMVEEAAASPVSGGGLNPARPVPALSTIPDGSPPFPCVPTCPRATAGSGHTQARRAQAPPLLSALTLSASGGGRSLPVSPAGLAS